MNEVCYIIKEQCTDGFDIIQSMRKSVLNVVQWGCFIQVEYIWDGVIEYSELFNQIIEDIEGELYERG